MSGSGGIFYWPQTCLRRLIIKRLFEAWPEPLTVKELTRGFDEDKIWAVKVALSWLNQKHIVVRVTKGLYTLSDEYKRHLDWLAVRLGGKDKLSEYLLKPCSGVGEQAGNALNQRP